MDSYKATTRIITILNHIAALRNFIDPRKNLFKFVCSWTWNIFVILMITIVEFRVDLYFLQTMPLNIERFTYMFQYITHAFGYTSIIIIGLYQSKVSNEFFFPNINSFFLNTKVSILIYNFISTK